MSEVQRLQSHELAPALKSLGKSCPLGSSVAVLSITMTCWSFSFQELAPTTKGRVISNHCATRSPYRPPFPFLAASLLKLNLGSASGLRSILGTPAGLAPSSARIGSKYGYDRARVSNWPHQGPLLFEFCMLLFDVPS